MSEIAEYKVGYNFCVIGPISQHRTWTGKKGEAIEHAKLLMNKNSQSSQELLVVKVVARVRRANPPIEVINVK